MPELPFVPKVRHGHEHERATGDVSDHVSRIKCQTSLWAEQWVLLEAEFEAEACVKAGFEEQVHRYD
jgi:hypothetical protein